MAFLRLVGRRRIALTYQFLGVSFRQSLSARIWKTKAVKELLFIIANATLHYIRGSREVSRRKWVSCPIILLTEENGRLSPQRQFDIPNA